MFQDITTSLLGFGNFSPEQLSVVFERLKIQQLQKDECLIKERQVSQSFYFINKGSFRHYTVQENGEEATLNLFIRTEWVFEYKSFVTQQPSQNIIQATADSEVFGLSVWDFHELVKVSDSFFRIGGILEQAIQNQDFQHNRLTPEEKYELLLATKPLLLQHFPLKHIASYMGMTPETLSRIRKKLSS
ncbi:MAG: Crp/Fnr family transcriptional regulator [Chitinophagaceae bacterium]